ncbi:glycosyltransferase [Zhihengliuella sp.]|uniref:glycosyltransferase n=1 Tax=Zhihengliuella sp. TaxID=1954483 RepID=UPI0028119D2F|nr:glycosyltransferase [Zhihengliuella sp.]
MHSAAAPGARTRHVAMLSLHTSPLDQPGSGDAGGLNVYVAQLSEHLGRLGVEVDVFTRVPAAATGASTITTARTVPGVSVHHVPVGPESVTKTSLAGHVGEIVERIAAWYRTTGESPDVVHSHYWVSGLAGLELAERWDAPLVHTMHTMARVKLRDDATAVEPARRLAAEDLLAGSATALTANTPSEVEDLESLYGADRGRISLVPPGVDHEVFRPHGPASWFAQGPCGPSALRVVFAGRIQRLKGPHLLLEALQQAVELDPGVRFDVALIGHQSGPDHLDLAELLPEDSPRLRIRLVPPRRAEELAQWFRAADVAAVPSYSESFGLVAAEAQACGTPVLANAVGGLRHTVADGRTGRLIAGQQPADWARALADLSRDRGVLARMGSAAVVQAAAFAWETAAATTLGIYDRVSAERPSRRSTGARLRA